jgi:hypothetical protein
VVDDRCVERLEMAAGDERAVSKLGIERAAVLSVVRQAAGE